MSNECNSKYMKQKRINGECYPIFDEKECNGYSGYKWNKRYNTCLNNSISSRIGILKMSINPDFSNNLKTVISSKKIKYDKEIEMILKREKMTMLLDLFSKKKIDRDITVKMNQKGGEKIGK